MPETLWAPWRLKYIERPPDQGISGDRKGSGDIFLDLPAEEDDRKNLILFRGSSAFVMLNAFPYTSGHLLIAPFRQVADIDAMTEAELIEVNLLLARTIRWLRTAYRPDGFNVGVNLGSAAGAGIPVHVHWHVVPRWAGDTNFMSSVGDVRVLPESLGATFDRLTEVVVRDV